MIAALSLLITLLLQQATTQPATTQAATLCIAEPAAGLPNRGQFYTLKGLNSVRDLKNVVVIDGINARDAARFGLVINAANLQAVLLNGKAVVPDDKLLGEWSYAPWAEAKFEMDGRKWSVCFFLGGLGFITDDAGHRAAFKFAPPQAPG